MEKNVASECDLIDIAINNQASTGGNNLTSTSRHHHPQRGYVCRTAIRSLHSVSQCSVNLLLRSPVAALTPQIKPGLLHVADTAILLP